MTDAATGDVPDETCSRCGARPASAAEVALEWMRDTDAGGATVVVCPACTREHVRAIEAKLDAQWW